MALEVMSLPLRRMNSAPTCGVATTSVPSRQSGAVSSSADLLRSLYRARDKFALQGALRHRSRGRAVPRRATVAVHASQESPGSIAVHASQEIPGSISGSLMTVERPCANSCPGSATGLLENWLESSLIDIVRHLPEAPFLQYVFKSSHHQGADRQRIDEGLFERPAEWGPVKQCLLQAAPDGIILVHRLDKKSLSESCLGEHSGGGGDSLGGALQVSGQSTDVWGLLVHGCSVHSNACYILKTTRVTSSSGILTHFCVSRAKCFGPSIKSQMQSTWLL